jgi:hypothetical protein
VDGDSVVRAVRRELEHHVSVVRAVDDVDPIHPVVIGALLLGRRAKLLVDALDMLPEEEAV